MILRFTLVDFCLNKLSEYVIVGLISD